MVGPDLSLELGRTVEAATALKVTAHLHGALVLDNPLHLDGLLASGAYDLWVAQRGRPPELPDQRGPEVVDIAVPLDTWSCPDWEGSRAHGALLATETDPAPRGHVWGWKASVGMAPWAYEDMIEVRKRACVDEMVVWSKDSKATITTAALKPWDLRFAARGAQHMTWECIGDAEAVEMLLGWVTHLGKKRNHGHGRVARWEVEVIQEAAWQQRALPAPLLPEGVAPAGVVPVRAPYWHSTRWCMGRQPW